MEIYNIIAELCSEIIHFCEEDFFIRFSCVCTDEKNRIDGIIKENIPSLFEKDYQVHILTETDLTDEFYETLRGFIKTLAEEKDYFATVRLIQILDKAVQDLLREMVKSFQDEEYSLVMNNNREQTGVGLLPRCGCDWERKGRLAHHYNRLDNFLFNLLLMENSILGELIDKHIFLKDHFFERYDETKKLRIAATALKNSKDFSIANINHEGVNYFQILYDEEKEFVDNELVWQKICDAADEQADIVVFPEMLGNRRMESFVSGRLEELPEAEREKMPSLIVLPSYWYKGKNTASVLDKYGNVLCRQNKQNPFRFEYDGVGCLEGIYTSFMVNIFHYEGIGRFAILICKDFLTTKYLEQLMRCFKLTLILVPSFSTGSYDFVQSFDLCAHDDCNVVWINTCAAMEKGKESNFEYVGYVRKRIARSDDESQKLCHMKSCEGLRNGTCRRDCLYIEDICAV